MPLKSILSEQMAKDVAFCAANPAAVETSGDADGQKKEVNLMKLQAYEQRLRWVKSHSYVDYHSMFNKANRQQATETYDRIVSSIPNDYIRKYFLSLAVTAEAFLTIRTEFAKTLAVSSLFGYILGIGDRHLENLLLDVKTGAVIQIDFGICFGMGSSVLPVPEFMPFRLTPQLRAVLQPLDGVGLLRHYMVQCMQVLREDACGSSGSIHHSNNSSSSSSSSRLSSSYPGIIPNALEVYVNDPVIDWLKGAASTAGSTKGKTSTSKVSAAAASSTAHSSISEGSTATAAAAASSNSVREEWQLRREDLQWEPRRRVHVAVQKLLGADPATLLINDLALNPVVKKEKSLRSLSQIVLTTTSCCSGGGGHVDNSEVSSVVATTGKRGHAVATASKADEEESTAFNTVGEQVDKLISLATDADVLVRQWSGLQTWL